MFTWTSQSRFSGYKRCLCFISRLGSTQCLTPKQFMKLQFDIGELHPQEKLNTLHKISFSRERDGWETFWLKSTSTGGNSVKPIFNWVQFYLCTSTARSAKSELQNFTGWATLSMCEHSLVSKGRIVELYRAAPELKCLNRCLANLSVCEHSLLSKARILHRVLKLLGLIGMSTHLCPPLNLLRGRAKTWSELGGEMRTWRMRIWLKRLVILVRAWLSVAQILAAHLGQVRTGCW